MRHSFHNRALAALALLAARHNAQMAGPTRAQKPSSQPVFDEVRQELSRLVRDFNYHILCRLSGNALPAVATGTTTSKVKTVNSVNYFVNGVPKTKAGTDDLWTLAGTTFAAGLANKYLLLLDAAGVASVQEGVPAATPALVTFGALPPTTKTIIGVLTVTNATNPFVPGVTLLGAAGVVATYVDGLDPSILLAAEVTT